MMSRMIPLILIAAATVTVAAAAVRATQTEAGPIQDPLQPPQFQAFAPALDQR